MKKLAVLLLVLFCAMVTVAQDAPKVEVFGGYQYTSVDTKGLADRQSFNGWDADVAAHVSRNFSIVGDISGTYKSEQGVDLKLYNYLFGPRISGNGKVSPFAQALFGVGHLSAGALGVSVGTNGFAMALGGGVDVNANKHFALRLAKFEYLMNHVSAPDAFSAAGITGSENLNNYRIATGIVFKF